VVARPNHNTPASRCSKHETPGRCQCCRLRDLVDEGVDVAEHDKLQSRALIESCAEYSRRPSSAPSPGNLDETADGALAVAETYRQPTNP